MTEDIRHPAQTEQVREALTLGRDAVMESFEHVTDRDDQLLADMRLRSIDAAIAGQPSGEFVSLPIALVQRLRDHLEQTDSFVWLDEIQMLETALSPAAQGKPDCGAPEFKDPVCAGGIVANAVFLDPSINNLTIAKDRIRWLSRQLIALAHPSSQASEAGNSSNVSTTAQCGAGEVLLPCPFCGAAVACALIYGRTGCAIRCTDCSAQITSNVSKDTAIEYWNTRSAPLSPVRAAQEDAWKIRNLLARAFLIGGGITHSSIDTIQEYQGHSWLRALDEADSILALYATPQDNPQEMGEG